MRILFWGTPGFATPALRALLGEGFEVVGVVTQPDRAQGRSRSALVPSPVKRIALEEGIPVLQPERPRGEEFLSAVRELAPDVSVVVAYGHILTQEVIDLPRLGTLNIHASLLPRWRGAAPIQAALLAGDAETGVTIMRVVRALDAGPILCQARSPVAPDETFGEVQLRLSELGALILIEALARLDVGAATETPQDDAAATYAPKIEREMTRVRWDRTAAEVSRVIRAFDPRPGAFATQDAAEVKLFAARHLEASEVGGVGEPGEVLAIGETGMVVACGEGAVRVGDVQPAGKRRMHVTEWARGRGVATGSRFAS